MPEPGKVVQVIGPVIDVQFPEQQVPEIYSALKITDPSKGIDLTLEVQQHLGREYGIEPSSQIHPGCNHRG